MSYYQPAHLIVSAAATVAEWMERNGHHHWQLGNVCDRRICDQRDALLTALKTLNASGCIGWRPNLQAVVDEALAAVEGGGR